MQPASATRSGSGPSDAALVVAARAGEAWAAEALFHRHARGVNGLAYRLIGRDADVDDLVQDSFIEALSSLSHLREPQAFAGWLRSIVVHRATKLIRRRRLLARLGLGQGASTVDVDSLVSSSAPADIAAELTQVYRRIQDLPGHLRVALILRRVEGYTLDEIAEVTRASLATVKRRLVQAERSLSKSKSEGVP